MLIALPFAPQFFVLLKMQQETERERKRERERKKERGSEKEREGCFCRRRYFLLLAPGSALEKFAAAVNPGNKPAKVNWALSWSISLKMCEKD